MGTAVVEDSLAPRRSIVDVYRYASMALVLFPISLMAVNKGGWQATAFVFGVMLVHILLDNLTGDLGPARTRLTWMHDVWLVAQFPWAVGLLAVLLLRNAPLGHPWALTPGYESFGVIAGGVFATSFMFGGNTVVGHEMMHRRSRWGRAYAWLLLTVTGDGQFLIAHLHGHHQNVGSSKDPATARRGEGLYGFVWRSTIGQYRESYLFEVRRLKAAGRSVLWVRNRVVLSVVGTVALISLVGLLIGHVPALIYLSVILTSKVLLEAINYIQHYGLVRELGTPVMNRHSWDCRGRGAGTILFGLSFHADHHAHPTKPMWDLQGSEGAPRLVHGYMFALLVAFIPPLWFRYTKDRLDNWDNTLANDAERALLASSSM